MMTIPRFHTLVLLTLTTSVGLVLQAPAHATDPTEGRYEVVNTVDVDVPFHVQMQGTKDGKFASQNIRCWLIGGVDAVAAQCPGQQVSMPVELRSTGEYTSIVAVDFLALELWAVAAGIDLEFIGSAHGETFSAEAEWIDGHWVCTTSEVDAKKCNTMCGLAGGSVSAEPEVPSNNPFAEPACTVTCDCNNSDAEAEWIDQPEVLASGT